MHKYLKYAFMYTKINEQSKMFINTIENWPTHCAVFQLVLITPNNFNR